VTAGYSARAARGGRRAIRPGRSLALAAVAAAMVIGVGAARALASPVAPTRADVQRALDRTVAGGAPGAAAVIRGPHGVERYSAGLSNVRRGVAISPRDHERAGSVTKAMTATIVLQLVAAGRIELGDTVERWLPGLVPNGDQITVRELLGMSSGLAEYCGIPQGPAIADLCTPSPALMSQRWTPRQLVEIGVGEPPLFAPGQGWAYSNTNYVLLGMIIERVTGHSLAAEYRDRIFRPLGLKNTRYAPGVVSMPRPFSHGYDPLSGGTWPADVTRTSPTIAGSAGAIVSVPNDLQRFMRALLGGRLVPPRLLRQMKAPTPGSLNGAPPSEPLEGGGVATYGLGLEHFTWSHGCGVYGHSGAIPGFHPFVVASVNGRRGAAMYVNTDALEAPGVIAFLEAQRLVACRMRFGHIGSR
jgi:D-alanyl-D-alanine carboxypeptidase